MAKTNEYSLKAAIRTQVRNINHESRTISQAVCACIRAEREQSLAPYYKGAQVPAANASNSAIKAWGAAHILPLLPSITIGGRRLFVGLVSDKKHALQLAEGDKYATANIKGVQQIFGNCISDSDKRRALYLSVEKQIKVYDYDTYIDKDGHEWRKPATDADGKGKFHTEKRIYYLADAKECAPLKVVREAFFEVLGLHAALIAAAADEAEAKTGKLAASQRKKTNTRTLASEQVTTK